MTSGPGSGSCSGCGTVGQHVFVAAWCGPVANARAPMLPPSRWLAHSPMTEPGELIALFTRLPSDVAGLNRVVQGLLVHGEQLEKYGDNPATFWPISSATLQ